jgi:hypothetical protein
MKQQKNKKKHVSRKGKEAPLTEVQGEPGFSGSGYNAPGNVDHGKITSNKKRR